MVGYQRGINYMCSISYPVVMEGKDGIIPNLECHVLNNSMVSATGKMQCEIRYYLVKVNTREIKQSGGLLLVSICVK